MFLRYHRARVADSLSPGLLLGFGMRPNGETTYSLGRGGMSNTPVDPASAPKAGEEAMAIPSLHILVVDDEETIRTTLGMCLEAEGHTVVACDSAPAAIAAISTQAF